MPIIQAQLLLFGGDADHRIRTTLPLAQRFENFQTLGGDGQHIAFLRLVAPNLHRRHAGIVVRHLAQLETAASVRAVDDFRHGVGQATRADIVNRQNGIGVTQRHATVDDFLGTPLNFRVAALHRSEIQILVRAAGGHAGRRATAQTDQHRRSAQDDDGGSRRQFGLVDVGFANVAQPAGDHDRLVITAPLAIGTVLLEGAEITGQIGAAELVVERRRTDGAFQHDIQRRDDAARLAVVALPRLDEIGNPEVRDRESTKPRLRFGATSGRAFVADFTTRTGRGARKRRDRGRVVVSFHFHQDVDRFRVIAVLAIGGIGKEAPGGKTRHHRRIVPVGGQHVIGVAFVGVADHREQRAILCLAVDDPIRVKNFVPAVLGVRLREHHQFHIGRIAFQPSEAVQQIIDFVIRQRQSQFAIGDGQRLSPVSEYVHSRQRCRFRLGE